jgi:hypothetical protein
MVLSFFGQLCCIAARSAPNPMFDADIQYGRID